MPSKIAKVVKEVPIGAGSGHIMTLAIQAMSASQALAIRQGQQLGPTKILIVAETEFEDV